MHKFLLSGLTMAALAACAVPAFAADSAVAARQAMVVENGRTISHNRLKDAGLATSVAPKDAEGNITFTPKVTQTNGAEFLYIGAVRTVNGVDENYGAEIFDGEVDPMTLPAGEYTFFAYGLTKRSMATIFIVKENVKVAEGFSIDFSTDEGKNVIAFKQLSPSGKVLSTNYDEEGTLGDAEDVIMFNGQVAFWNGMDLYFDQMKSVQTNVTSSNCPLEFTRIYFAPSATDGMLFSITPVDFTKKEVGSTAEGWNISNQTIVDTPVKVRDMEEWRKLGLPESDIPYTFVKYFLTFDNQYRAMIGTGVQGVGYDAAKIGFWYPENYSGKLGHVVFPMGSVVAGDNSGIKGMPVTYQKGKGVIQLGLNPVLDPNLFFTAEGRIFNQSNPAFSFNPDGQVLGNCTPSLVTLPYGNEIDFGYIGRNGEAFGIDSWNMAEKYPNAAALGDDTNKTAVYLNGKLVNDKRVAYPSQIDWSQAGTYKIEFSTDNVLIDNKIPGVVKGSVTYDSNTYGGLIPTMTLMQFRDADGKATDRFAEAKDATMNLYAAVTKYKRTSGSMSNRYTYYEMTAPTGVTVEWAPTGSTEFKPLTVEANPAGDYIPGFGSNYNVSLASVEPKGWIDVRVTVKGDNGTEQVQTITPAVYVAEDAAVDEIAIDEEGAPAEYYNLQGIRIAEPKAGETVICRKGNKVSKLIAR